MSQDFFYDGQIRRYLLQFIRIFSNITYQTGPDKNGTRTIHKIPVVYGEPSWQAASILRNGSQNTILPVPLMAAWIKSIEMAPNRRQDPAFEGIIQGIERKFVNGEYTNEPGNRFTVERYMPVPYDIAMQLDIWTSNTETKLQILEQIMTIFNPMLQLQQSSNIFDWSSIFEVELKNINWSSSTLPASNEDRNVSSLSFNVGVWINPPAKLKRQRLIEQIVTDIRSITDLSDVITGSDLAVPGTIDNSRLNRIIVTPGNYAVSIGYHDDNQENLYLLNDKNQIDESLSWKNLINIYGRPENDTRVRLKTEDDIESSHGDIIGYISLTDVPYIAKFTVINETIPANTISPFNRVIDPLKSWPGKGLPAAVAGQRYLITSHISAGEETATTQYTSIWGNLSAYPNDIIQYTGSHWVVVFNSQTVPYARTINSSNNNHYVFSDGEWKSLYLGIYEAGYWRLEDIKGIDIDDIDC